MSKESKSCPMCGEEILAVAKKCKHCGEMLENNQGASLLGALEALRNRNKKCGKDLENKVNKNLPNWVAPAVIGGLILMFVLAVMLKPEKNSNATSTGITINTCEIHTIEQCKDTSGYGTFDCIFTNNSSVSVSTRAFNVWNYDSSGLLIKKYGVDTKIRVPPGGKSHLEFFASGANVKEINICSMNPKSI